jgi:hypothetical protein
MGIFNHNLVIVNNQFTPAQFIVREVQARNGGLPLNSRTRAARSEPQSRFHLLF